MSGAIPGIDGNGLAVARRQALSVPIGLRLGLSSLPRTLLPGASELPIGEIVGELDAEDVVVGTGDAVVFGGEEELESWFSGVNNAPGVVI